MACRVSPSSYSPSLPSTLEPLRALLLTCVDTLLGETRETSKTTLPKCRDHHRDLSMNLRTYSMLFSLPNMSLGLSGPLPQSRPTCMARLCGSRKELLQLLRRDPSILGSSRSVSNVRSHAVKLCGICGATCRHFEVISRPRAKGRIHAMKLCSWLSSCLEALHGPIAATTSVACRGRASKIETASSKSKTGVASPGIPKRPRSKEMMDHISRAGTLTSKNDDSFAFFGFASREEPMTVSHFSSTDVRQGGQFRGQRVQPKCEQASRKIHGPQRVRTLRMALSTPPPSP